MIALAEASARSGEVLDEVERAVVGKRQALTLVLARSSQAATC